MCPRSKYPGATNSHSVALRKMQLCHGKRALVWCWVRSCTSKCSCPHVQLMLWSRQGRSRTRGRAPRLGYSWREISTTSISFLRAAGPEVEEALWTGLSAPSEPQLSAEASVPEDADGQEMPGGKKGSPALSKMFAEASVPAASVLDCQLSIHGSQDAVAKIKDKCRG